MIEARAYQIEAVESVFRFMERGYGNPVVVAPTGAGKSIIIAMNIQRAIDMYPPVRILILADAKELIEQNSEAFTLVNGMANYGIYSASVGAKCSSQNITFAQIQSCHNDAELFGFIDFIIVDECHMINVKNKGMYRKFIDTLRVANPKMKVVGYTATPYRLGHGYVFKGDESMFSGVAFEIGIDRLIKDGFLVMPIARAGKVHADTDKIERSNNGEFKEESAQAEFSKITVEAVRDIIQRLPDRKSILVFTCSIKHSQEIAEELYAQSETSVEVVTGETSKSEREAIVERVRSGTTRWLVNCAVFTKGFNAKNIDAVVLLRATESPALFVQMVGRGLRTFTGKSDCVVLDYGENVMRHGPINAITPKEKKKGASKTSDRMMAKECGSCGALIAIQSRTCPHCGFTIEIEAAPNHGTKPSDLSIIDMDGQGSPECVWRDVLEMTTALHGSNSVQSRQCLRVNYRLGVAEWVTEYVCPDHGGYARQRAAKWMEQRGFNLMDAQASADVKWPVPRRIKVKYGGKWPEVVEADVSIF